MNGSRLWAFVADMNNSGAVTISDVWLWFKWLYFYPGDLVLNLVIKKYPDFAQFFEFSVDFYGGVFSGILSFFLWILIPFLSLAVIKGLLFSFTERNGYYKKF